MAWKITRGARPLVAGLIIGTIAPAACLSGESGPLGPVSGSGGTSAADASVAGATGDPCIVDTDCLAGAGTCLTSEFVTGVIGSPIEIPGGYCSSLGCTFDEFETTCGPSGYCFDLRTQGIPLGVCGKVCDTDADCRTDYRCTDGDGPTSDPLPRKVCLPPGLICALDIPIAECPEAGAATDGGDAASD